MAAWTAPRTWAAAEKPPAATMNTHIRDNLLYLYDGFQAQTWTAYTPTIVGTASPTLACYYLRVGKMVTVEYAITLTAAVTAKITMSLPSTAATTLRANLGGATLYDTSASAERQAYVKLGTSTVVQFEYENATPAIVDVAVGTPWTWAAGDQIMGVFTYREV